MDKDIYGKLAVNVFGGLMHLFEIDIVTELRYIQEFLGYASAWTVDICMHVSEKGIRRIENLLDQIMKVEKL